MKAASITSACIKNNQANFGARFTVTPAAIKLIKDNNYFIGRMENDFALTDKLNKEIGETIYETALEFTKRNPKNFAVILGKLPNDNLALSTRPIVYQLDKNNKPVECMVEIPYTPQRITRLKQEALALLEKITPKKPTNRITLNKIK